MSGWPSPLCPVNFAFKERRVSGYSKGQCGRVAPQPGDSPGSPGRGPGVLMMHHWGVKIGTVAWSRTRLMLRNRQTAHSVHSTVRKRWSGRQVTLLLNLAPKASASLLGYVPLLVKWSRAGGSHSAALVSEASVVTS